MRLDLFFDFINLGAFLSKDFFGYNEVSPFLSNGVFRTRTLTNATAYGTAGRTRPTYPSHPVGLNLQNGMSPWRTHPGRGPRFRAPCQPLDRVAGLPRAARPAPAPHARGLGSAPS